MKNATRIYFVRTRNRSRILETLACRILDGRLAFGIARAPASESSPSRKKGREDSTKRLEEAIAAYTNGDKFIYRRPHVKNDPDGVVTHDRWNVMGGVLDVAEVVPVLFDLLLGDSACVGRLVPAWAWRQDEECLGNFPEYHDMLCKLRNQVERGSF